MLLCWRRSTQQRKEGFVNKPTSQFSALNPSYGFPWLRVTDPAQFSIHEHLFSFWDLQANAACLKNWKFWKPPLVVRRRWFFLPFFEGRGDDACFCDKLKCSPQIKKKETWQNILCHAKSKIIYKRSVSSYFKVSSSTCLPSFGCVSPNLPPPPLKTLCPISLLLLPFPPGFWPLCKAASVS